jgi:hypothetical protein
MHHDFGRACVEACCIWVTKEKNSDFPVCRCGLLKKSWPNNHKYAVQCEEVRLRLRVENIGPSDNKTLGEGNLPSTKGAIRMDYHSRVLVMFAALLVGMAGLAGVARAEIIEPDLPIQQTIKAYQPLPTPRPRPHPISVHRLLPERAVTAAMSSPQPVPHCAWFACNQYVIVGIGF